jgi:hypothetical protein
MVLCTTRDNEIMSATPLVPASNILTLDDPLPNLLFEFPGADVILRSRDTHHFRVPKSYIVNGSPILGELIRKTLDPPDDAHDEASLPVVQLPESGAILHSLLTFIFPVPPLVPSTTEKAMELLSVAQKYQMVSVLIHIRGSIARQHPPSSERDTALHIYSLAQKYGLHQEALQAARTILKYPITIEDLEDKLDNMPGASLYELWKYYENVRAVLRLNLMEFRTSGASGTLTGLPCGELSSSQIPRWLDDYIESIGDTPNLFDLIEFNTALSCHLKKHRSCACASIPNRTTRNFWEALASVVDDSVKAVSDIDVYKLLPRLKSSQADSALPLVQEREDAQAQVNSTTAPPQLLEVPEANLIIRSSDLVNFRVHKPVLAMASPFFRDLLSLPQPPDSESVNGLPVIQLPEDAELLNCLISMLYPVPPVTPNSYDKVLYLLAACQKYDMIQVQSSIRAEVNRGSFPVPAGTEVFGAYAIASSKGLIPELENAARLTLDYPMTFETLGEGLRLFDGCALRDLAHFRKRCRDNFVTCLKSFLEVDASQPSSVWLGCPDVMPKRGHWEPPATATLPSWLCQVLSRINTDLKLQVFTHPLNTPSNIREEYLTAIQTHGHCNFCLLVHATKGTTFCVELESRLARARDKVNTLFL